MGEDLNKILANNQSWSERVSDKDGSFFADMAHSQAPKIFWIGCCDSRVAPTEVCDLGLGDVFLHSNIANQVREDNPSFISALEYATTVLNVRQIIVCGHTNCGGVLASISGIDDDRLETVSKWLEPIRELYRAHKDDLAKYDDDERVDQLSRINIKTQVDSLSNMELIKRLRDQGKAPKIDGLLYDVGSGKLLLI